MIPWLVGHGKSIAHSAWSFAFVTKNPTKVQKCNFFAFGRPWKFPWPTPWKFPGPENFHGLNLLLPMEISRAWKFPWHGKFQALTPTYPCRIFLMENILQWIYLCSAICCCLFEIFTGKKTKGRVGQRPNSFQYFLRKPSRLYSNFCFNYFHFGSEKEYCVKGLFHFVRIQWGIQARQMEKLWNGWKACHPKSVLNQIWKQPGHFFVLLVTEKCLRPRGKWSKQKRENVGKIPTLRDTPPPPCGNTHVKKFKVYFVF